MLSAAVNVAVATVVLAAAADPSAIDQALEQRDAFEHDRAIQTLRDAADGAATEQEAAPFLWHLGALLAETRRVDEAKAAFKRAAASGERPRLRVVVAPSIQALIDDAVAAAPRAPPPVEQPLPDDDRLPEEEPAPEEAAPEPSRPASRPVVDDGGRGLGPLAIAGGVVAGVGAVVVAAGAVVWGLGLVEHAAATSSTSQREAAAHNEVSAPLQLSGQVAVVTGASLAILGAVLFLTDGE